MLPLSWPLVAAAVVALLALVVVFRLLSRAWPQHLQWDVRPILVPAAGLVWTLLFLPMGEGALSQAAALAALRANPFLVFDVAPLSSAGCFRLLAWPLAPVFGDALAVRLLAGLALAMALLLVHPLARGLGAGPWTACLAQAIALALPETRQPLVAGRFPGVVGTAGELAVLVHLVRRLPVLEAARDGAAACAFLFGAQSLYPGAVAVVLALVVAVAGLETATGHRRRGRWLLGAYGIALGLVILTEYAWAIPAFARVPMALADPPPGGMAAMPWRLDVALLAALAATLLVTRAASGAALRTHVAALIAAAAVVAVLPVRLGLDGHALAFGAASLASLAAVALAGLTQRALNREKAG